MTITIRSIGTIVEALPDSSAADAFAPPLLTELSCDANRCAEF